MVDNQPHHPQGDFALDEHGVLHGAGEKKLTYSGIGVYRREFLDEWQSRTTPAPIAEGKSPRFKIRPLLDAAMERGAITGNRHGGSWTDVGTPERLASLNA
jgi:MurNAc alpha-1-phosphate uridylyltransferase